jgi:hypothetical protein
MNDLRANLSALEPDNLGDDVWDNWMSPQPVSFKPPPLESIRIFIALFSFFRIGGSSAFQKVGGVVSRNSSRESATFMPRLLGDNVPGLECGHIGATPVPGWRPFVGNSVENVLAALTNNSTMFPTKFSTKESQEGTERVQTPSAAFMPRQLPHALASTNAKREAA